MGLAVEARAGRGADVEVLVGTHLAGEGHGYRVAHFDTETGLLGVPALVVQSDECGFFAIAPDGKHVYGTNSIKSFQGVAHMGGVSAFTLDAKTGKMTLINQVASGGENPAHISLDKTGKFALVANYAGNSVPGEGGSVAVFAIKPDGSLGDRTAFDQHKGTGPDASRQTQAFAHSVIVDPTNKFALVADLGLDKVFIYKFDAATGKLAANDPPFVAAKPGSGPRHMSFHPNGKIMYLVQEMMSMVTAFKWDDQKGVLTPFQEISVLPSPPSDFKGTSTAAEVRVFPNGKWLYASNRGTDTISQFSIDPETFKLTYMGNVPSGGQMPRNF
ncbi:MAG TPA: lactonase family protein, partial [Phycisphaerae bacterium]